MICGCGNTVEEIRVEFGYKICSVCVAVKVNVVLKVVWFIVIRLEER